MAVTKLDVQAVKDLMAKSPGMSYVDAARQVRGTPAPTPTAPKLTEQEVRQGMTGLSVPERQQMRANLKPVTEPNKTVITPIAERTPEPTQEVKAPEPVAPPSPPAPVVTPVPEVKTEAKPPVTPKVETPKVEPIVDRTSQIQTNLATGYNTDPNLFTDRASFDKAYNYASKPPEEQAILDSFYKSKQPTINSFYDTLVTGGSVTPEQKNNPSYRVANVRYQKVKMYDGMSQSELANSLKSGDIIEGSQEWEDLKAMNPKLAKDGLNLFKVNGGKTTIFTKNEDGTTTNNLEINASKTWEQTFKDLFKVQSLEEIRNEVQTEDFKVAQAQANEYAMQLNELQDAIDAIDSDVDKEFAKTGATKSRIALEKADRNDALGREYNSVNRKYLTQFNIANQILTQNTANIATRNQQQQKQNEALFGIYQQQMQNENALKLDQAKFEQGLAQQAQLAKDPLTAIKTVMDEYKKLGIPFTEDIATKVDAANAFIAQGGTIGEYVTNMISEIQKKPEYKRYQAIQAGQLSDIEKLKYQTEVENARDTRNFSQQLQLAQFNKDAQRSNFLFELQNDPAKMAAAYELEQNINANKSLFDILGKNVGTYEGNRGYDLAGKLGDPLPAGGNWKVISTDTAGEFGTPYKAGTKKPYGNTVVMQDENGNTIRYSHLDSIGVKAGDVLGFGDIVGTRGNTGNVLGKNGEKLTAEQLQAGRGSHLDIEIKDSSGKLLSQNEQVQWLKSQKPGQGGMGAYDIEVFNSLTPSDKKKMQSDPAFQSFQSKKQIVMNDENADIYDVMKFSQGGKDMGEERLKGLGKFSQGLSQISELSKKIQETSTGPIIGRLRSYNPYDANAQALVAEINSVVPNIARGVYGEVGVLTDADIANYAKTLPNIKSTEDTNKLVLAMTLKTMLNGFKGQIQIDGAAGRDVSGFGGTVKQYESKINSLLNELGGTQTVAPTTPNVKPELVNKYLNIVSNTYNK